MVAEARRRGVDGVICGHIHCAEIRSIDGILYCNDGDWVESCTALVEHLDGTMEIVRWAEMPHVLAMSRIESSECTSLSSPSLVPANQRRRTNARCVARAARDARASADLPYTGPFFHASLPLLSGNPAGAAETRRHGRADHRSPPFGDPHRDGGASRSDRPMVLPPSSTAVHDVLPHPVSGVCPRPVEGSAVLELRLAALVPWSRVLHHGLNSVGRGGVAARGFDRMKRWSRGVDTRLFRPRGKLLRLPAPCKPLRRSRRRREECRGFPAPRSPWYQGGGG